MAGAAPLSLPAPAQSPQTESTQQSRVPDAHTPDRQLIDLNAQADALTQQGKYADAILIATAALKQAETSFGPEDPRVSGALNRLASIYFRQARYAEAEPLFQRALQIFEKTAGPDSVPVAHVLNNLAVLETDQGKYSLAEQFSRRALAIDEKLLGPDHPDVATDLNNLGQLLVDMGRYNDAEPLYEQALAIDEKAPGSHDHDIAIERNNLGLLYDDEGRYSEAEPTYKRAAALMEKALGPEHPNVATVLCLLAHVYVAKGRYNEAEALYISAGRIREKAYGTEHPDVATSFNLLAQLYVDEGKYAQAEPLFLRAGRIWEKVYGPDHPLVAQALEHLAKLYMTEGRYADAEPLLLRVGRIREKKLGMEHVDTAAAFDSLAELYVDQGKYVEAEPLYKRAIAIIEKALGPDRPAVAAELNNLGLLYVHLQRYGDAEALLQRALSIREKALGPQHLDVAQSLNNLAWLDGLEGKLTEAEPLYRRALSIREAALGPDHPDTATSLNNLAMLEVSEGRLAEAEPQYQRAMRIWDNALGPDHPTLATAANNLATLYVDEDKLAQAEPLFRRSLNNLFNQFQSNFRDMTEKERLEFLQTVSGNFSLFFSFVDRYRQQDPALTGEMYNLLLWEKGMIAGSITDMRRKVEASGDSEALRLLGELTSKRTQLAALLNSNPPNRDLWRRQVAQLAFDANNVEKALVARSSAFAAAKQMERVTWQQVRDALGPDEAAVEFARFRYYDKKWTASTYYVALVVTSATRDEPQYIFLGDDKQIEVDALAGFENALQTRGFGLQPKSAVLPGAHAYERIWKPLEDALGGVTRIYIAPDGVLNTIPLGIIPAPDGKLLMERYDLRLVSSTKDLLRHGPATGSNQAFLGGPTAAPGVSATSAATAASATKSNLKTALLIGNPLFDLSAVEQAAAESKLAADQPGGAPVASVSSDQALTQSRSRAQPAAPGFASVRSRDLVAGQKLPPLPGTGIEVAAIASLMQSAGWKTEVFANEMALKSVVERTASPGVLHLATHGFFLPDQPIELGQRPGAGIAVAGASPAAGANAGSFSTTEIEDPMLRSGLYFAGANRTLAGRSAGGAEGAASKNIDNGVLTALEAGNLDLTGTELVVLSACNTGQGEVKNGEGVFGLRRALEEAGAQSVMMSLWSVPDKETLELMKLFYAKWLGGIEKHEALKQAQLEMRARVRSEHDGQDLPYYWAAFVLVGR